VLVTLKKQITVNDARMILIFTFIIADQSLGGFKARHGEHDKRQEQEHESSFGFGFGFGAGVGVSWSYCIAVHLSAIKHRLR
jgi:hypothetical protein